VNSRTIPVEADFEFIAESIPHMVWVSAPDGNTEYFNRIGSTYTGAPPEANHGWKWVELVHPEDAERARARWQEAVRTETPFAMEYRIRRYDGPFRWHVFRAQPVRDGDGRVTRWIGTATDVEDLQELAAEVQRTQRQALESLTLLETLQSAAPVGFAFVNRDLRLVRVNPPLAEIAGLPAERQVGRRIGALAAFLWPDLEARVRRVLNTGEARINDEHSGQSSRYPGRTRHWMTSYYPVRVEDEVVGVGLVVVDVTERKSTENFRALLSGMLEGLDTYETRAAPGVNGQGRRLQTPERRSLRGGPSGSDARRPPAGEVQARPERPLTPREREVLKLLAGGLVAADVAETLSVDLSTVRYHVRHILEKLEVHTQLAAVILAVREGLVQI
jgi:PAS domain S-box-containing protein